MKTITLTLFLLLAALFSFAQQDDISFTIEKIKVNYPGYAEKTRGINFDQFAADAIRSNMPDTFKAMATIVSFFKDRHLDLFQVSAALDTIGCKKNIDHMLQYFNSGKKFRKYEGYWINESRSCIIGIRQTKSKPLTYEGYVVQCWPNSAAIPGMQIFNMEQNKGQGFFAKLTTLRSRQTSYVNAEFRSDSVLTTGPYYKWHRIKTVPLDQLPATRQPQDTASGKWLNPKTFLLTIPTGLAANGEIVDSIIRINPGLWLFCEHLIIDVRANTGGRVRAFAPVYPLLYTGPIINICSTLYGTQDESDRTQKDLDDYLSGGGKDSTYINAMKYWVKFYHDSIGKFVSFPPDTMTQERVMAIPKKVSIIVNFGCQSACEMFLLNAKQSKKVKLFGEHTMGAVDYLNFYPRPTPSGKYNLYIATRMRNIPPGGSKLDGKGIEPDVPISDTVPDWVDFVAHYYDEQ